MNDITEAIGDQDLFGEDDDLEEGDLMQQFEVEDGICKSAVVNDVAGRYSVWGGPLLVRGCLLGEGGLLPFELEGDICNRCFWFSKMVYRALPWFCESLSLVCCLSQQMFSICLKNIDTQKR